MKKMDDLRSIYALAYFNLLKTGSWVEDRVKEALKPLNLTHAQLNALYILFENDPQPVSASEIKDRILVSNPDVTRLLDRLVKKGYVSREACPHNRRKMDISLTDAGHKMFERAHSAAKRSVGDFFEEKISEQEASELRLILQKVRR
jgi:DNA-binding MarR family transcriptional regulator